MEAWIAQKAEEDRKRRIAAQMLGAQAEGVWNRLRAAIKSCVSDFNSLYREEPAREVECVDGEHEMVVSLKSRPQFHVRVKLDPPHGLVTYRTSRNHQSMLADEMLIFAGLTEPDEVLRVALDDTGAPYLAKAEKRVDVNEASELILGPVLFPAEG